MGGKWKATELQRKGRKKQKDVKDTDPVVLTNDDYNIFPDRMDEVVEESWQKEDEWKTVLFKDVSGLLQVPCMIVKEVWAAVSRRESTQEEDFPSDDRPTEATTSKKEHKVQITPQALDLVNTEMNKI